MSKINFAADGSIIKNNRVIESMADAKPLDYFNLSGNLKLAGSIRATDFIKEDGTSLPSVTVNKLALPENVYYVNKKLGVNQENPLADFDVKGTARVQGELGVEGSMGVSGNVVGKGTAAFAGKVMAEDELAVGKAAVFGGSVLSKGKVVAEDELAVGKDAIFAGRINAGNAILLGSQNVPHPDVGDGAFYRADGQVQIATDDLIRLRHVGTKETGIQFDVRRDTDNEKVRPGDIQNPNGQTKISRWGIMFGGENNDREVNSAQISAGLHHADSLNIVGMSANKDAASRRVDMWAEGGFSVFGPQKVNGPKVDTDHILNKQAQPSGQSVSSRGGWIASDMGAPNDQNRVVIGNLGNRATVGAHNAKLDAWAPLHLNPEGDQNVVIGGSDGSARLAIKGTGHEHGTAWFRSDKGPNVSHVHWGGNGDWYIRSAKPEGGVIIQDSAPNGNTNIGSNLNLKGGVSIHNPDKWGTHFPWNGDQKNYIRGDTEIRGDTNQMGVLNVATNVGIDKNFKYTPDGNQLTIGKTDESNLRLGRHPDYSWIQSHGSKPLRINPLGNEVCINNTCLNESALKNLSTSGNGNGTMFMIGYRNDGNVSKVSMNYDSISDDMNMLTILPAINTTAQSKAAVYFNIKLKDGAQPGKFTVISDDGISFEYGFDSPYLNSTFDWNGIPGQLNKNNTNSIDNRGWKGQGATPYEYTIPNDKLFSNVIKCKLTWYQGGGGVAFQIKGLKTAINALGTLA